MPEIERKQQNVNTLSSLGEILRRSGAVTEEQLAEARKVAEINGVQLGRVLVLLGHTTDERVKWALKVQADLRHGDRRASRALQELLDASLAATSVALARLS